MSLNAQSKMVTESISGTGTCRLSQYVLQSHFAIFNINKSSKSNLFSSNGSLPASATQTYIERTWRAAHSQLLLSTTHKNVEIYLL